MEQFTTFAQSGVALGDLQLFRDIAPQEVMPLLADCPVVRVAEGEIVADARHKGGRLYIVLRGALSVMHADAMSAGERATAKVLPGECVGELSVLDESGRVLFFVGSQMELTGEADPRRAEAVRLVRGLTARQRQVLEQMVRGHRNKQIAASLGIDEKTIKMHRAAMLARLGCSTSADAIRIGVEAGLAN